MKKLILILAFGFLACGSENDTTQGVDYTGEGQPIKCMPIESCAQNPLSFACNENRAICGCNGETQAQIDNDCQ